MAGLFEKVTRTGAPTEYRHTIRGGNGAAAIHIRRTSGTSDTYYIHQDHLGSPELITGAGGSVVARLSFSAYGERRDDDHDGAIPAGELGALANVTRRGFTGHEHLDTVGLIHMNGRVYDPRIGRFLGVDPIVVAGASQGANSFAYVWNDPLNYTDPSGFFGVSSNEAWPSGPPTIGGGRIWSPFMLELYITRGPSGGFDWTPSAMPATAAYEPPAMQVPKESRATFRAARMPEEVLVASNDPVGLDLGEIGGSHLLILGLTANASIEADFPAKPRVVVQWIPIAIAVIARIGAAVKAWRVARAAEAARKAQAARRAAEAAKVLSAAERQAIQKIGNILRDHAQPKDIAGAVRDVLGNPVKNPRGGTWNHIKEIEDALRGLRKAAGTLKDSVHPTAVAARERAIRAISEIEAALAGLGI